MTKPGAVAKLASNEGRVGAPAIPGKGEKELHTDYGTNGVLHSFLIFLGYNICMIPISLPDSVAITT